MTRPTAFTTPIVALALVSLVWLSSLAPALAATVTDTFPLKLTGTERCRENPKFVETLRVKITEGMTITLQHDGTVIQATINTHGQNATIDAITLHGRALLANKLGSTAQLVLSGRDPGNPDHFMTFRGTATFDKAGNLIKVTGTYLNQITGTYTIDTKTGAQSPPVDCLNSGTFATGKKPPVGTWTEEAYLKAQTPGADELFGNSLAVSGDMVAVGKRTGEVSIFSRNSATSQWSRSTVLSPSPFADNSSLSLDGNTLAVAHVFNSGGTRRVVNLYTRNTQGAWAFDRSILPPSSSPLADCWGCSGAGVILSGSTLVLNEIGVTGVAAGAVAIYRRDSSGFWGLPTVLTAPVPTVGDWFGSASSLSGDILAVGANVPFVSGSVYVFTYNPNTGTWNQPQQLNSPNPSPAGGFGESVAVSGDLLAVGSGFENEAFGVVYLFARDPIGGTWTQTAKLSGGNGVGGFGSSVGLAGDTLVVGSISSFPPLGGPGHVHVFTKNTAGNWIEEARVAASNGDHGDGFGTHLIFDGTTILVGATEEAGNGINPADNSVQRAGAAYVYRRAP